MVRNRIARIALTTFALFAFGTLEQTAWAQGSQPADVAAAPAADAAPAPLSDDELEVLVARIALYPDELIAVISEASLYPLQIVEASRFLEQAKKDKSLKPKDSWDGSVISLLNYPDIVKMMSDDLDWTQTLGDALTYQQKDVLIAIQQLRDKAVAAGAIKSDDKITVKQVDDNVVIQSANPEVVYVPQYQPEMLYEPSYQIAPISYYPDPYPSYWYPTAPYFAAAVTGAIFAAAVDWDDWGVWGGHWDGRDIDIDCDHCFNNRDFNGKVNFNDIDWKNVDRSKLKFDKDQFNKIDRNDLRNRVKADSRNNLKNRANNVHRDRQNVLSDRGGKVGDVRKSKIEAGLKANAGNADRIKRDVKRPTDRPNVAGRTGGPKAGQKINRPAGKPKMAARPDNRPRNASGLGNPRSGKREAIASQRGSRSMGGGYRGGHQAISRGGGGHQAISRGGGGHRAIKRGGGRRR